MTPTSIGGEWSAEQDTLWFVLVFGVDAKRNVIEVQFSAQILVSLCARTMAECVCVCGGGLAYSNNCGAAP